MSWQQLEFQQDRKIEREAEEETKVGPKIRRPVRYMGSKLATVCEMLKRGRTLVLRFSDIVGRCGISDGLSLHEGLYQ
jgi:hypothetical protein